MHTSIAEKVRGDSRDLARLTSADSVNLLLAGLEAGGTVSLDDVQQEKGCQDIKSVAAAGGTVYLYSETYLTADQARSLALAEDGKARVAARVREDSRQLNRLTGLDALGTPDAAAEADEVKALLADMERDDRYGDIKPVASATGALYLYSEAHITGSYAAMLARAAANDPCATIAATVRDEARIYPRPTPVDFFTNPVFNINPDELEGHLAGTLERPEFRDIKLINASTGARYLYSTLYLTGDYARSLVEWREVGEYENP